MQTTFQAQAALSRAMAALEHARAASLAATRAVDSFCDRGLDGQTQEQFDAEHERLGQLESAASWAEYGAEMAYDAALSAYHAALARVFGVDGRTVNSPDATLQVAGRSVPVHFVAAAA